MVDFGVFVDIGLGESSLIHVSQLSHQFIRDPHRRFTIGDALKVWVTEIDTERKRVKLTAIRPGSKKPSRGKPSRRTGQSAEGRRGKPRGKGKSGGGKPDRAPRKDRKPRKPKPVTPITDGMLKGDEPMRSFSDLAQFVTRKSDDKKDKK